jgi:phage gpG-like protein
MEASFEYLQSADGMSLNDLNIKLDKLREAMTVNAKILARETEILAASFVGEEMSGLKAGSDFRDPKKVRRKKNTRLLLRSGKLFKSFQGGSDTLTKSIITDKSIQTVVGSKLVYADIQNRGGKIKATPVKITRVSKTGKKSTRQVYRMSQFMWAMYRKTRNESWKWWALHVEKEGSVTIRPTKYFDNAMKKLKNTYPQFIAEWLADVVRAV